MLKFYRIKRSGEEITMNRIFICGFFNFPRGGAASNYVQHISNVFKNIGYKVYIVSNINKEIISSEEKSDYNGLYINPYSISNARFGHFIQYNFGMGRIVKRQLEQYNIDSDDIILAYSRDSSTLVNILKVAKTTGAKTGVCLVEWFGKGEFKRYLLNIQFWNSELSFYYLNRKFDFILPISTYIERYYKEKACRTFRIPCLIDTKEYDYAEKDINSKRIFIYPGNGKMKDSLYEMIQAISMLKDNEAANVEFHICGVGQLARKIIKNNNFENYLGSRIIIHDWMPYDELISLYQKAHFMILARDISRMTLANFPSKIPETLSYGIIPICSRVGDYTKLYLEDGNNCLMIEGCAVQAILLGIKRALAMTSQDIIDYSNRCRITAEVKFDYRQWVEPMKYFLEKEKLKNSDNGGGKM